MIYAISVPTAFAFLTLSWAVGFAIGYQYRVIQQAGEAL